jgi:hypothetical protein
MNTLMIIMNGYKKRRHIDKLTKEFWAHTYQTNIGKLIGIAIVIQETTNFQKTLPMMLFSKQLKNRKALEAMEILMPGYGG